MATRTYTKKDRPKLTKLKINKTSAETVRALKPTKGARDPEQVTIDRLVSEVHAEWVDAGKPKTWSDIADVDGKGALPVGVPEAQFETLQFRVRAAGNHLGLSVRFGKIENENGYTQTIFRVLDKKQRAAKTEDSAE